MRGGSAFGIYPFSRYRRVELSAGLVQLNEEYNDPTLQAAVRARTRRRSTARPCCATARWCRSARRSSRRRRSSASSDRWPATRCAWPTTSRRRFGSLLSRQTFDGDARHYLRLGGSGLLATRIRGFKSIGDFPDFQYFGGNSELRGYDYLQFAGQNIVFANAELRFPLIEAALTPIGVVGGVRGVFFAGIGGALVQQPADSTARAPANDELQVLQQDSGVCQVPIGLQARPRPAIRSRRDPATGRRRRS